jgi:hypothetical protein
MPRMVWSEIGLDGFAVRILKNLKHSFSLDRVEFMLRSQAVTEIRRQIWDRAKRTCEHCGKRLTHSAFEMHENIWRGRGGEVSVDNGRCLCVYCHQNDIVAGHGKRKVRFGESSK